MAAITISNAFDREDKTHDDREKQYMRTIKGYNQGEQQIFQKLFALLVEALDDEPDQDFLGEMFMGLNLGNHWKGQFFTPYNICPSCSGVGEISSGFCPCPAMGCKMESATTT